MPETLPPPTTEIPDIPMYKDASGLWVPGNGPNMGANHGNIVNINNNPNINIGQQSINGGDGETSPSAPSLTSAEAPHTTVIPIEVVPSTPAAEAPGAPAASPVEAPAPTPEPAPETELPAPEALEEDNELVTDGYPKSAEWTPLHGDEPHKIQVIGEYKNKLNGETIYKISSPNLEGMENHPIPASELNFDAEAGPDGELKEQLKQLIEQLEDANKRIRKLENDLARVNGEPLPHPDEEVDGSHEREEGLSTFTREILGKSYEWDAKVDDPVYVKKGNKFELWKISKIEAGEDGKGTITASKEGEEDITESAEVFIKWAIMNDLLNDDEGPTTEAEPTEPAEGDEVLLAPEDDSWVRVGDLAVYKRDGRTERFWRIDEQRVIERDGQKFVVLRNTHDLHTTQEVPYETYYQWHQEEFGNQGESQGRLHRGWARAKEYFTGQRFGVWLNTRGAERETTDRRSRTGLAAGALLVAAGAVGVELIEHLLMSKGHLAGPTGIAPHLREHSQNLPDHTTFYNPELGNHGVGVEMPHGWQMHQNIPGGEHILSNVNGDSIKLGWDGEGNLSHAAKEALHAKGLELHQDQIDYINSKGQEAVHYMTEVSEK